MGFLSPLLLLLGAAAAIPLVLHLLKRDRDRRVVFPALRYLHRATREHARQIRAQQLLLLFLRIGIVAAVTLAAARLLLPLPGGVHEPTAVALVLDNSLSSGVIEDDRRRLDWMKETARRVVDRATEDDLIWVLRAGEPWDLALPLQPAAARIRIDETEVSHARSSLDEVLLRASRLLTDASQPARELHVLSDYQTGALSEGTALDLPPGTRVLASEPAEHAPENRFFSDVLVGGGLPPIAGERTQITARVATSGTDPVGAIEVRLVVDGEVRAATESESDGSVTLPLGPFQTGWVSGHLEMDPDALPEDDRSFFVFRVREPPVVTAEGEDMYFLEQAFDVLDGAGRVRHTSAEEPNLVVLAGAAAQEEWTHEAPLLLLPPSDPARLPAFNRALSAAGIPWTLGVEASESVWSVADVGIPVAIEGLEVRRRYRMEPRGEAHPRETLVALSDGSPWLVTGETEAGPYLLLASPLSEEASDLPVRAVLIPFVDWVTARWAGGGTVSMLHAGDPLATPSGATHLYLPSGAERAIDDTHRFVETAHVGIHTILEGDSIVALAAVNAPPEESRLSPLDPQQLSERLTPDLYVLDEPDAWERAAFGTGTASEPWKVLLVAALLLLLIEGRVAASGAGDRTRDAGGISAD